MNDPELNETVTRDAELLDAIPHRPPMRLVDEIVERDENRLVARKTFHAEEFFFQGHYPEFPLVPGVILCEAGMQAGALLLVRAMEGRPGAVPVATRMNNVKFKRMVRPGETVQLEVTLGERLADAFYLTAKVTCEGQLAVRFDFACTLAEVEGLG